MISRLYLISLFLIVALSLNARISGTVCDSIGEPVAGAAITITQTADSVIVDAMSTDGQGRFEFDSTKPAQRYRLTATCLGFKPYSIEVADDADIDIKLDADEALALDELRVTTSKPSVRRYLDKFIIAPNSYTALANNSYDLLGLMPMISRDNDGYSILGGGEATIYMNGRRPIMSQEQVIAYLRSVPPQNVKSIEITQTSGASRRGLIINVILDKPDEGFLGSAHITMFAREDVATTGAMMAYYSKDRIAFSAMVHGGYGPMTTKTQTDVDFRDSGISESRYYKSVNYGSSVNIDLKVQYNINSKSYVGVFARGNNDFGHTRISTENHTTLPDGSQQRYHSGSKTKDVRHYMPIMAVATYHLDLDKKGSNLEVVADIDYHQSKKEKGWWGSDIEEYCQHYNYKSLAFGTKADMMKYIGNGRLDAGYSFMNAGLHDLNLDNALVATDDYHFREILHKAYANFFHKPAEWMQYSVGFRAEDIHQHIDQRVGCEYYKNSSFDVMPEISLTYFLPRANQQIKADYKLELLRPRHYQMNPNRYWSSESSYSQGNPYLKPSKCHIASLFYMWNYTLYGQVLFNHFSDNFNQVILEAAPGVTKKTTENFGSMLLTQILLGYQKMFFNRWQISAQTTARYRNQDGGSLLPEIKAVSWQWSMNLSNYVVISRRHRFNASVDFSLSSPWSGVSNHYRWNNQISVRLEKQFGSDWNVSFSASNFLPRNRYTIQETPELYYNSKNLTRQAGCNVSVRYTFGNNSVRKAKANENAVVQSRQ